MHVTETDALEFEKFAFQIRVGAPRHKVLAEARRGGVAPNKDGSQAAFEYIHKDPLEFPEPRYPDPIEINPAAFEWSCNGGGLERKFLAKLTERGVSLSMLRWNASSPAELAAGNSDFVFSLTDGLRAEDASRPAQTAVWSPPEEALELDGEPGTEALHISAPHVG